MRSDILAANCGEFANAFFMDYSILRENEAREEAFLTESSKSTASIAKSNKQGICLDQEKCRLLLINREAVIGYEQVAKRMLLFG